jgi:hypothetical protein
MKRGRQGSFSIHLMPVGASAPREAALGRTSVERCADSERVDEPRSQ